MIDAGTDQEPKVPILEVPEIASGEARKVKLLLVKLNVIVAVP